MPNHEEHAYFEGLEIIEGFDPDYWTEEWIALHETTPKENADQRHLLRRAFKLFINEQYAQGLTRLEWLPYSQAYRTYRNRVFAPGPGWDDQLTPPGLGELT